MVPRESSMKNPFPGMNPWLEAHWSDVHTRLMVYLCDALEDQLPADLVARVEETVEIDSESGARPAHPDVQVVEDDRSQDPTRAGRGRVAVAEPLLVELDEPETERHVEIVDREGRKLVTAVEVLSPSNKIGIERRARYSRKQRDYLAGGASLVEVDLLRDGEFVVAVPPGKIPPSLRTPYLACVRRSARPQRAEIYRIPLRARLPVIPVPLRVRDPDAALDLQSLIDLCFERGRYSGIDYGRDPEPPLSRDDARWADEILRAQGLRA